MTEVLAYAQSKLQGPRVRQSLQRLDYDYWSGTNREPLENLVKALAAFQKLPADDPNSYFHLSGWHGEPFRGPGQNDKSWWGGYCHHGTVLFPTWHRCVLLKLEEGLRRVENGKYADVTWPYWDELAAPGIEAIPTIEPGEPLQPIPLDPLKNPLIPKCMTEPQFTLFSEGGKVIPNPLYSYTLPRTLRDQVADQDNIYTKTEGYSTCRFPYSGLVGTPESQVETRRVNAQYTQERGIEILNENVKNWLQGTVTITPPGGHTRIPVTTSLRHRFLSCLKAPNYTVFSNTSSQAQWYTDNNKDPKKKPFLMVSLESPHNGMHLALGGVYVPGNYDADDDKYRGANGDMGCNETASFDPIFYMHHAFIDYMFWKWQELHDKTKRGSLEVIEGYDGTVASDETPVGYPRGSIMDMNSPIYPFKKTNGEYYTSHDVTDITELGYTYAPGSVDAILNSERGGGSRGGNFLEAPHGEKIESLTRVSNINRAEYKGSFAVRIYMTPRDWPPEKRCLVAIEPILSRWNTEGCANCQNHLQVHAIAAIHEDLKKDLLGDTNRSIDELRIEVGIQTYKGEEIYEYPPGPLDGRVAPLLPSDGSRGPGLGGDGRRVPYVEHLYKRHQ